MIHKAVLFTLVVALIVLLAAPTNPIAAQDDAPTDEFILSAAELALGVFVAPGDFSGDGPADLAVSLAQDQEGAVLVYLTAQIVPRNGQTYNLTLTLVPVTQERGLRWDVAAWVLTDAEGVEVDDPPGIIAILIAQLKRGFARAVFEGLQAAVQERYPDGLPGRPQGILPYIEQGNLALQVTWGTPPPGESLAAGLPAELMGSELPVIDETEDTVTHYIEQDAINTAANALALQTEPVETLSYKLSNVYITSVITLHGPDEEAVTLELAYQFHTGMPGDSVPSEEFTALLGTGEESGALYVLESATNPATGEAAPAPLADRAAQIASRALNRYLATQVGFADVSGLTVVEGGIEVTVNRPDAE